MELVRLAVPRRAFTIGHIEYVAERITWLHRHRELIGGLRFVEEPPVMRFFFGKLEPVGGDWEDSGGCLYSRFRQRALIADFFR
jgi:tryptophanase